MLGLGIAVLASPAVAETTPCRNVMHEGTAFTICEVDLRKQSVRLFLRRPDGEIYGRLSALPAALPGAGKPTGAPPDRLQFAMNAGMYHADLNPVGLYVEAGREVTPANTRKGPGNFHLKPNGIFHVTDRTAGVMETAAFLKARPKVEYATQSGPMLVINGRLHPKFSASGESRKLRNGVGVRDPNTVVFAISEGEVSFGSFGRLFLTALKCPNALFLDGSVSTLYAPSLNRGSNFFPLGPLLGVYAHGG